MHFHIRSNDVSYEVTIVEAENLDLGSNDEITVSIIRKTSQYFNPLHAELLPFILNVHVHNIVLERINDY